jgi:hypothetical protein
MTTKALFVRLEAKAGKENEVAKFLRDAQGLVQREPATTAWFGIRSPLAMMPRFATRRATRNQPSRFSARRFLLCA